VESLTLEETQKRARKRESFAGTTKENQESSSCGNGWLSSISSMSLLLIYAGAYAVSLHIDAIFYYWKANKVISAISKACVPKEQFSFRGGRWMLSSIIKKLLSMG
jgi:hypothetical protein